MVGTRCASGSYISSHVPDVIALVVMTETQALLSCQLHTSKAHRLGGTPEMPLLLYHGADYTTVVFVFCELW